VKYELNVPAIKWRVGFGDDPELVNSVIVTASGLLFGAGRDNALRARDTDTGAGVVVAIRRRSVPALRRRSAGSCTR
jgi:hypothetical protein